ncbi:MAG: sodium-dependent transporter, partial [Nitrospirae bacterium]|nr:sodium-dependent transporter [Nitrospirota bacterium]
IWCGIATWALGFGTAFSFNIWSDVTLFGMTFFDNLDYLTSNIMLPLGGICIAIFAGWILAKDISREELAETGNNLAYQTWQILIRYIAPIAVLIVLFHAIGVL